MNLLRTNQTAAVQTPVMKRNVMEQVKSSAAPGAPVPTIQLQTKVSKSVLDDSSMILSSQFLGNVAAQYRPPPPPPFVPVIVQKVRRKKKDRGTKEEETETVPTADDGVDDEEAVKRGSVEKKKGEEEKVAENSLKNDGVEEEVDMKNKKEKERNRSEGVNINNDDDNDDIVLMQPTIDLPAVTTCSLPPLEVAAPARNLCLELLSARIVAVVRAVCLLLQEFSSSPGQSLPHVALIGSGNVGHTILSQLVKMLPPDRIVVLARDEKSDICSHFANKFGVRSLSTNTLRDERLVDVVRNHREQNVSNKSGATVSGGASSEAASHVSPEVAAAHNISVALQQVHVLIVACRPSQLNEVASSLQPWLRSSAVTVVSALTGVTADRVATLFRVPSSLSATVDTNEMLFAFESASILSTKQSASAAAAAAAQQQFLDAASTLGGGGAGAVSRTSDAGAVSQSGTSLFPVAAAAGGGGCGGAAAAAAAANSKPKEGGLPFRFFARDPMDFLHRLFFALVTTLLERCGVQPTAAWIGAGKLLLGRPLLSAPSGIGVQGPLLVSRCSVQHLAAASGLSVGEVLQTVDNRLCQFAGIQS